MSKCFAFLDDIIVPAPAFAAALQRLRLVFEKHNLKPNADKCDLFCRQLRCCGHITSEEGVSTDPKRLEKLKDWPLPQNSADV